ncbi:unnamed protein product [Dovyalis caffra]|uniref:DUF4283 domain-containing protein n=1 Tax=Dovyalis caffra TaxID=77055 RepID=A0AAV1SQX9_9ROSI|nr:unnamed protein product [Dovyalis caffra]
MIPSSMAVHTGGNGGRGEQVNNNLTDISPVPANGHLSAKIPKQAVDNGARYWGYCLVDQFMELDFDNRVVPIWIHLWGVPLGLLNEEGISYITSVVGMPLNLPKTVKVVVEGVLLPFDVQYTWQPACCDICYKLGHEHSNCSNVQPQTDVFPDDVPPIKKIKKKWIPKPASSNDVSDSKQNVEEDGSSLAYNPFDVLSIPDLLCCGEKRVHDLDKEDSIVKRKEDSPKSTRGVRQASSSVIGIVEQLNPKQRNGGTEKKNNGNNSPSTSKGVGVQNPKPPNVKQDSVRLLLIVFWDGITVITMFSLIIDEFGFYGEVLLECAKEVKTVVFSLNGEKAPKPDGYKVEFFNKAWSVVSDEVT